MMVMYSYSLLTDPHAEDTKEAERRDHGDGAGGVARLEATGGSSPSNVRELGFTSLSCNPASPAFRISWPILERLMKLTIVRQ
ncbi:unnamed protein product [Protopolystoma xenopodis]|uniref:Uncharacterized protein n=1 Tax=Protopolystoma xenopodis TaxID=117903 RepID=A0A3S4ZT06_9PLAT|nr:unnamed protein product [Protopolystoma xenopodis]